MNVLIFVMTMLMLLAMLTYGRLATYSSSQVSQLIFEKYMEQDERAYINTAAEVLYSNIHKSTKEGEKQPPKVAATSLINVGALFGSSVAPEVVKRREQSKIMLKALMRVLYADAPFFKDISEKRPTFLDDLISSLIDVSNSLPKEEKWKKVTDLAGISLPDKELDQALYLMLKGAAYEDVLPPANANTETEVDEEIPPLPQEDFHSKKGHFSLLDFITFSPHYKIRLYLAPKEILEVVFPDKRTVADLIQEREHLYKQAMNGFDTKELSKIFESHFDSRRGRDIERESLDYNVSKTRPPKITKQD